MTDMRPGLDAAIAIVQQSLDTVRSEDDGENRAVRTSIAAREHVLSLLTGYRDHQPAPPEPDAGTLAAALLDTAPLAVHRNGCWARSGGPCNCPARDAAAERAPRILAALASRPAPRPPEPDRTVCAECDHERQYHDAPGEECSCEGDGEAGFCICPGFDRPPEPDRTAALTRLVERAAAMGYCSQTHHEHLMRNAQNALTEGRS